MNVERPFELPLAEVVGAVARARPLARAELVGLAPAAALEGFPDESADARLRPRPPGDRERIRLLRWPRPDASAGPSTAATPPASSSRAGAPGASPRRLRSPATVQAIRAGRRAPAGQARPAADVARRLLQGDDRRRPAAADRAAVPQAVRSGDRRCFPIVLGGYTVVSYYTDKWVYDRRQRKKAREGKAQSR